jgi:hypothetical protein
MIGVIGGYGMVGSAVVRILHNQGYSPVKAGVRRVGAGSGHLVADLPHVIWKEVDAANTESLDGFLRGCSTVIDCSTVTDDLVEVMALKALRHGANFITLSVPQGLLAGLPKSHGLTLCCRAGSAPGLSGLLQSYLASMFDQVDELVYCYSSSGQLSAASAQAIVDGIFKEQRPGIWADGSYLRITNPAGLAEVSDWFFPGSQFFARLDSEAEAIAIRYRIANGVWLHSIGDEQVRTLLSKLPMLYLQDRRAVAAALSEVTSQDAIRHGPQAKYLVRVYGSRDGQVIQRELRCSAKDPMLLTAAIPATLADSIEQGAKPLPNRDFALTETPKSLLVALLERGYLDELSINDRSLLNMPVGTAVSRMGRTET